MTIPIEVLEAEVMRLDPAQRARLLGRLLSSLDRDAEWEAAWAEECDRREARIASGEAQWQPVDEAIARIRAALK